MSRYLVIVSNVVHVTLKDVSMATTYTKNLIGIKSQPS